MARHVLLLDLINDPASIARYEDWHRVGRVPPRVIASIRGADITAMDIWRLGDRLVMVMETGPAFDGAAKAQADASDPDIVAWETMMDAMQRRIPGHDGKWAAATRIFDLSEHQ